MTNQEEKELRQDFIDAKAAFEEAVAWQERAKVRYREAEVGMHKVLERLIKAAGPTAELPGGGTK